MFKIVPSIFLIFTLFSCKAPVPIEEGVSINLASLRKLQVDNVIYSLHLDIPANKNEAITGEMKIKFEYSGRGDVVLDFKAGDSSIIAVKTIEEIETRFEMGHLIIPSSALESGSNELIIDFVAGDMSLNRNNDFLYTLFVPDRASTAFPLFDQPDIKAIYNLTLTTPLDWQAIANGESIAKDTLDSKATWYFRETAPLSTYLFSFATGKFKKITREQNGRTIEMLHRETDSAKVARNVEDIFDLHFKSLAWLEEYTGIPYPFKKFGFVLIPSFQYGGMEHPGAILYNASGLFLEPSHTQSQLLGRASVIAHETAHMWFGDLVTMKWFNDVWMKEVFANFMAAKIINPAFPEINHDLRFLMAHYPSAYSVDRTRGANPIQQDLDNLKNAGQMYGAIIYQKAPIVMRHLERFVGEEIFRKSLQQYLEVFSYENATWDDLVRIIDDNSDLDATEWSEAWVKEPGMPNLEISLANDTRIISIAQNDNLSLRPQQVSFRLANGDKTIEELFLGTKNERLTLEINYDSKIIIPNPNGFSYGRFNLNQETIDFLLSNLSALDDPVLRGSALITLNEAMLNFELPPATLLEGLIAFLPDEPELQNAQYILGTMREIYWKFLTADERISSTEQLEALLLLELSNRTTSREKATIFNSFVGIANSQESLNKLYSWWAAKSTVEGLTFSENDLTGMAYTLAVNQFREADSILSAQLERIKNPDRKQRMQFVIPALSPDKSVRDNFFNGLKNETNREQEPWVLDGLRYLHHPLRANQSVEYILPSLELLEEIQKTGDIFFPTRWLASTFSGHTTEEAARIVDEFLQAHPDYPLKLREKILQTSDDLFRAAEWNKRKIDF